MTPPGLVPGGISSAAFADLLARAMAIGKAAALLLDPGMEASALAWLQRDLMPRLADRDFAVIVKDRPDIVTSIDADGLHLTDPAELKRLRGKLGDLSIGATSPLGRHEAMIAAELGADYIAFDATVPDVGSGAGMEQALPLVQWWGEMMTVPSVAIVESPADAKTLAAAGADFIAIGPAVWQQSDPLETIQDFAASLAG